MKAYTYNGKKNSCGEKIRILRMEKGLTQGDLAAQMQLYGMEVDQKAISRIELRERTVSDFELWVISEILQVEIMELLQELPQYEQTEQKTTKKKKNRKNTGT